MSASSYWAALFLMCLIAFAILAFPVWTNFIADCDSLGWMPVKDLPARCVKLGP